MLTTTIAMMLLISGQTPESQFKKHSGDNIKIREDFYQGAERYHKRFLKLAAALPKKDREAILRSDKQSDVVFDMVDSFCRGTGFWGTISLDTGAGATYDLRENYYNAARYLKHHNKNYLKAWKGKNGDKKWAENMRVLQKWGNDKEGGMDPAKAKKKLADIQREWKKYVDGLPTGPALKSFLKYSLAEAVDGQDLMSVDEEG